MKADFTRPSACEEVMSHPSGRSQYVVLFENGSGSDPVDLLTLREMISAGLVGVRDRISKDGSEPTEFYLFDELVDLWDVENVTFDIGGDPRDEAPDSGPPPTQSPFTMDSQIPSATSAEHHAAAATPLTPLPGDPDIGVQAARNVLSSTPGVEGTGGGLPPETSELLDDIAAMLEFEISDLGSALATDTPGGRATQDSAGFAGYDALSDKLLDPITIRDLLFDGSLYTALAVSHEASEQELNDGYLKRAELIAQRQRGMEISDLKQVAALEDIRRLAFQAFEFLRDEERRSAYDRAGHTQGTFPSAAQQLGLSVLDPDSEEFRQSGTYSSASRLQAKRRQTGESSEKLRKFSHQTLSTNIRARAESGRFAALRPQPRDESLITAPGIQGGPRVYTSPHKALQSGELSTIKISEDRVFTQEVPTLARDAREEKQKRKVKDRPRRSMSRNRVAVSQDEGEGLEWGVDVENAGSGFLLALMGTLLVCGVSIIIVTATDFGDAEFSYGAPSPWYFGRNALLIVIAVVATLGLRRESVARFGVRPAILLTAFAVFLGAALGWIGSLVAPIRIIEPNYAVVLMVLLLQAVSHELYFRGFVARVLLLELRSPLIAVVLSCLFYGVFFLTFRTVLNQEGFYQLYYSLLLYGFGLGGIYGWLYFKGKSLWPGMIAHYITLVVAFLASPVL